MNINLEIAKLDHILKIKKGYRICFKKLCKKHFNHFTNKNRDFFKDYIIDLTNTKYCFNILHNNNYCGNLILELNNDQSLHICYFFILPNFQKLGIGSLIFKLIEEQFNEVNKLYLETFPEEKTCKFYEKNSFKNIGKSEDGMEKYEKIISLQS